MAKTGQQKAKGVKKMTGKAKAQAKAKAKENQDFDSCDKFTLNKWVVSMRNNLRHKSSEECKKACSPHFIYTCIRLLHLVSRRRHGLLVWPCTHTYTYSLIHACMYIMPRPLLKSEQTPKVHL